MKRFLLVLSILAVSAQCSYCRTDWYESGKPVDTGLVDVLYLVSTNVISARDAGGAKVYQATLTGQDRRFIDMELTHMRKALGDSVNFFAPYYHQFTFETVGLPKEEFGEVFDEVTKEIYAIFDDYMANINDGRRFVLAGFSQGAMHCLSLVKHMTPEQYSRLVAVYMMGYRLSEEDLKHPRVKAADGPEGNGVTVSFNSVTDTSSIWPLITEGAATCINPMNWKTDATSAVLDFHGDNAEVSVDTVKNVLVVRGLDEKKYIFKPLKEYVKPGNLHHWDILFYMDAIRDNLMDRAYHIR